MANSLVLTKAQNAVTAHDWVTAARLYKELLRSDSVNVTYIEQLANIYVRANQDEKAIPYYEQIIRLNPSNTSAMVSLGGIYRRLKRYNESVEILHKAQDIENSATVNYNLGFTYKEMGDYDDAVDAFESVITQNPDDVLAHNHLGSIYYKLKNYDKSISAFKRGLQVDRNHPILNYNLAHDYEDLKNYPDAVRCYEIALKTRPGWLDAIRDFSELLIKCQNTKQAQELVEQSIKLHPDDVELLCILGRIYLNQFDYDNATKTFSKADSLKQKDIKILVGLAKSLEKGMKIDAAMEKITEAKEIAPDDLEVCKQYAHILLSAQRYEKALDLIKTIDEKSDGNDLQILDLYGQYFVCRGDEEAANTYFEKIKKVNHHYKDYMINAADRYIQTGNYDKAEAMADSFIQCRPQLGEGYNVKGTVQNARGELTKAKTEYEKAVHLKNPNIYAVKELEKIYDQLQKNKEMYNDEEAPISIDADDFTEDETEDKSPEPDVNGFIENDDGELEYAGMESVSPIDQSLAEDSDEFWGDFDDDPDAENKPLADEEDDDAYDENAEDADLMSYMTPDADNESLEEGLLKDEDEFDFSDFEDEKIEAQEPESAPEAGNGTDADAVPEASAQSAPAPEMAAQPESEPMMTTQPEAAPEYEPMAEPQFEPQYEPQPAPEPVAEPAPRPRSEYERSATLPADFSEELDRADQMMRDLKQQQKNLELQQREFELQQRELADELRHENERMIDEKVDRAVDKAVDQAVDKAVDKKLQAYDLPEVDLSAEPVIESEPEPEFAAAPEVVVEPEPEPTEEPEPEVEISEPTEEPVVEEEISEPAEDSVPESVSAPAPFIEEEYTDYPFLSVDDILLMGGGRIVLDSEETAPAPKPEETDSSDDEDMFITADDMLDKIGRILNDDKTASVYAQEIELFKKLKALAEALPESEKNSFSACRMRMMIDYIIAKMSGKPGLLVTAESLLKSGVLGKEYDSQLTAQTEEELSNDLIRHVLMDMKNMAKELTDKRLSESLCVTADSILEKIALINQKCAIFG